jgi:hypothetical protein
MLDLQHHHNKCTTTPHMIVGPSMWSSPSYKGLLCTCCNGVVYESNPITNIVSIYANIDTRRNICRREMIIVVQLKTQFLFNFVYVAVFFFLFFFSRKWPNVLPHNGFIVFGKKKKNIITQSHTKIMSM